MLVPGKSYWASALGQVRIGDFVVFENPADREHTLVKRVCGVQAEGYEVKGLVSWGSSSKDFGVVKKNKIIGKLLYHGVPHIA